MYEIDWRRASTTPRAHQKQGVRWLIQPDDPASGRIYPRCTLLADEVGAGKSKQIVDSAQILYEAGDIDTVVVFCPAPARAVWADPSPEIGEVAKHGWASIANGVVEYCVRTPRAIKQLADPKDGLMWLVSNYEFIRREERLEPLLAALSSRKFWLVCDEAWALKDQNTAQWKATFEVRKLAWGVTLLNGTPVADTPMDLNAQMRLLDERILGFRYRTRDGKETVSCADYRFKHYYAGLAPRSDLKTIMTWKNQPLENQWPRLEELRARIKPYALRRLTRDCFDLPTVLDPITIEAKLSDATWRVYREMRDEMVTMLDCNGKPEMSLAKQAIVKIARLTQITSGFLGGLQEVDPETGEMTGDPHLREIGREKLDGLLDWLGRLSPQPDRYLIWSVYRAEIERTAASLGQDRLVRKLYGQQSPEDRKAAVDSLNPAIDPGEPVGVVGSPMAGGAALNLAGASLAINMSHTFNLRVYLQARGRIDRPGQVNKIRYVDVVATGPKGQRTIDHHVIEALRAKEDVAKWTAATWRRKITEE